MSSEGTGHVTPSIAEMHQIPTTIDLLQSMQQPYQNCERYIGACLMQEVIWGIGKVSEALESSNSSNR